MWIFIRQFCCEHQIEDWTSQFWEWKMYGGRFPWEWREKNTGQISGKLKGITAMVHYVNCSIPVFLQFPSVPKIMVRYT
jgi:hypothetical protein